MEKELSLDSKYENKLYMILYQASNNDYILNPKEFKIWSRKNYKILNSWYTDMLINKKSEIEHLIISTSENKFFGGTVYYRKFGEKLMNEAYNLIGLKKFLLDFGNMKDKSSIEVELWEYYLIFATLFGITDKIDDELKELYHQLQESETAYISLKELYIMMEIGIFSLSMEKDSLSLKPTLLNSCIYGDILTNLTFILKDGNCLKNFAK